LNPFHTSAKDLDPFALPTETRGRYLMLIAAMVALAWGSAGVMAPGLVPTADDFRAAQTSGEELLEVVEAQGIAYLSPELLHELIDSEAAAPSFRVLAKWGGRIALSLLLVLTMLGGAAVLYRLHPRWRGLAGKARPLAPAESPRIVAEIQRLIQRARLSPTIALAHISGRTFSGLAFGTSGREVLALVYPTGFLEDAWAETLRPIAYHELGHLANGDIHNQERARAMWIMAGLLVAVLVTLTGVRVVVQGGDTSTLQLATRHLSFVAVLWWIWAGLVRAREHYADWRVVTWGSEQALRRSLGLPPSHRPWWLRLRRIRKAIGRWPSLERMSTALRAFGWYHHPSHERRVAILDDPRPLYRVSSELAFLTGLLLTTIVANGEALFDDMVLIARSAATATFLIAQPLAPLALLAVGLGGLTLLAYPLTSTLGVQVQREAVADLVIEPDGPWGYLRQSRTAFLFALGLEAGLLVTPASLILAPVSPLYILSWLAGFTVLTWLWLIYVRAMSRFVLGATDGSSPPRKRQRALTWLSTFLLAILYSPALTLRITLHSVGDPELLKTLDRGSMAPEQAFVVVFVMSSIVLLALALLVYVLLGLASTTVAAASFSMRRPSCPTCGSPATPRLPLGRTCPSCGSPLSSWILHPGSRLVGRTT